MIIYVQVQCSVRIVLRKELLQQIEVGLLQSEADRNQIVSKTSKRTLLIPNFIKIHWVVSQNKCIIERKDTTSSFYTQLMLFV